MKIIKCDLITNGMILKIDTNTYLVGVPKKMKLIPPRKRLLVNLFFWKSKAITKIVFRLFLCLLI